MFRPERVRPEHDSIFGNTYRGVPNPMVAVERGYPTRNHGPIFTYAMPSYRYMRRPVARAPYAGLDGFVEDACRVVGGILTERGCEIYAPSAAGAPPPQSPPAQRTVRTCADASGCMADEGCCQLDIIGQGMPNICMPTEECRAVSNSLAVKGCSEYQGTLQKNLGVDGKEWLFCEYAGEPPVIAAPPASSSVVGGGAPAGSSGGITVPKVALAAAGVLFILALLS